MDPQLRSSSRPPGPPWSMPPRPDASPDDRLLRGRGLNLYALNNLYPLRGGLVPDLYQASIVTTGLPHLVRRYKLGLRRPGGLLGPDRLLDLGWSRCTWPARAWSARVRPGPAGGVTVTVPSTAGYLHQEGMILSRDGHCRAFDADASGIVAGSGAGVVVLRRLTDAVAGGDRVLAVIRGSAINKRRGPQGGLHAPASTGATVIAAAHAMAGRPPHDRLRGGPWDGTALATRSRSRPDAAFQRTTARRGFCALAR